MQEIESDYGRLLQILQVRWKGNLAFYASNLHISESKASRILNNKQEAPLELLDQMAAMVGIEIHLNFNDKKY